MVANQIFEFRLSPAFMDYVRKLFDRLGNEIGQSYCSIRTKKAQGKCRRTLSGFAGVRINEKDGFCNAFLYPQHQAEVHPVGEA